MKHSFGQKLALSVISGFTFIEWQSFDNFNEGVTLIESVERYKTIYGCYPEVVQADQIYRNRANLAFCKQHGIRLSGPRLGRPGKDVQRDRETEYRDRCERNIIEDRNGMAKRRFGLDLMMALLPETAMTEAALQVLCMNTRIRLLFHMAFFTSLVLFLQLNVYIELSTSFWYTVYSKMNKAGGFLHEKNDDLDSCRAYVYKHNFYRGCRR